jgi:hypothetical protein
VKPVEFHPDAAREANDAVDYYEGLRAGLGDDFRVELDAALARIQQNPQLYAAESGSVRVCRCTDFPIQFTMMSWQIGSGWLRSGTRAAARVTGRRKPN